MSLNNYYTNKILDEIKKKDATPRKLVKVYKEGIKHIGHTNWLEINKAICEKWDFTTLEDIKHKAEPKRFFGLFNKKHNGDSK